MRRQTTLLLSLLIFVSIFFSGCNALRKQTIEDFGEEPVSTFILVRHAEKDYGGDPVLTVQGTARAERLMEILKNTDLDAVYSTQTKRTMATGQPTADDHGLNIIPYAPNQLEFFSKELKRLYKGKTVLVVGHSNTTPALANYLTNTNQFPRFSELDYTNLYVVTLPRIGKPRVLKMRY
jgi:2,3-bisphosphoglycerate-dependent phosphoglycerate mutase